MQKYTTGLPLHPEQTFSVAAPAAAGARSTETLAEPAVWTLGIDDRSPLSPVGPPAGAAPAAVYRLLKQIGEGAMGEVWEAEQTSLGRVIAVKRLRSRPTQEPAEDALREADFRSESAIAASLEHPNILPVYDLGRDAEGGLLLAMKRVHGTPWNELLKAEFAETPVDEFLGRHIPILMVVTQAVAFAHSRGIIHRDLKPSQVLIGAFGEVLLTDWGLAVRVDTPSAPAPSPRRGWIPTPDSATNPAGTPALMAPEQTETHGGNLGPWTDVYLLGGTLHWLLTGTYPHAADSSQAAIEKARSGQVQPLAGRVAGRRIPPELEQLCLAALEPDRNRRLASAAAFLKGLEDFQRGTARKQKATELAARVASDLDRHALDYGSYPAAISALDEAHRLWPDQPGVAELRQRALHDSARLALKHGDLGFARLQCDAMHAGEQADALRRDVVQMQVQVDRRRSRLRLAVAAAFSLLLVVALGSLAFSQRMRAANQAIAEHARETEQALQIAMTRNAGAFELINFVLNDLKQSMDAELGAENGISEEQRNRIAYAIAGKVASPIVTYFNDTRPETWPEAMQLQLTGQIKAVADRFRVMGRYPEAMSMLQSALALRLTLPDPEAEDVRQLLNELAINHLNSGDFPAAVPLLAQLIAIEEPRRGTDAPEIGELRINLGTAHWRIKDLDAAEQQLRRAIAIFEAHPEYTHKDRLPHALNSLSGVLDEAGRVDEAVALAREALRIGERDLGPDHVKLGGTLNNLARALQHQGRPAEAEPLYHRAIAIVSAGLGPEHPAIGSLSFNLGRLKRSQQQDRDAQAWLERSLSIRKASMPDSPNTADSLRELGLLLLDASDHAQAEPLLREALALYARSLGADNVKVGLTGYDLGRLLRSADRLEEARQVLQDAHAVLRTAAPDGETTTAVRAALDAVNAQLGETGP